MFSQVSPSVRLGSRPRSRPFFHPASCIPLKVAASRPANDTDESPKTQFWIFVAVMLGALFAERSNSRHFVLRTMHSVVRVMLGQFVRYVGCARL